MLCTNGFPLAEGVPPLTPILRQILAFVVFLLAGTTAALADPPSRVGRISYLDGPASLYHPGQGQWTAADLNFPVTTGDSLWSGQDARLEIQIGATEIRLDEMSQADILRLDEGGASLRIDQGVVNVHLVAVPPGGIQIVTAAGQVEVLRPGSYHIDAGHQGGGVTQVGVIDGSARLSGSRGTVDIRPGEAVQAGADMSSFTLTPFAYTAFDNWAMARERNEQIAQSAAYVSPEMTGYQDLAANGQWAASPEYGPLWIPMTVGPDWAPYRFGRWAYVEPWGWTWIDDAPWGFAPFHYGRWVQWHDRWAWYPGRIVEHPVYAPALVAFIGAPGAGINAGPGVGWVPLGPQEAFHPYYRVSDTYVRNVNINHVTTINSGNLTINNYVNRRALTVVPTGAFTGAAPVNRAVVPLSPDQLGHEQPTTDLGHLRPTGAPRPGAAQPGGGPAQHPGGSPVPPQERPAAQIPAAVPAQAPQPQMQPHPQPQMQPVAQPQQAAPQPVPQPQPQRPAPQPQAQPQAAQPHPQPPAAQPQQQQHQAPPAQPAAKPQQQQPHQPEHEHEEGH